MAQQVDPAGLYTDKADSYLRFIALLGYERGLRGFFRRSPLLRPGLRVLDAGCGAGAVLLAVRDALRARGLEPALTHGFDLTPAMLERFRHRLEARREGGVELARADVLHLDALPQAWTGYDLIVSASMLEYVPRDRFADALHQLRLRIDESGTLVLFSTRRNWLMRLLIEYWWKANLYAADELGEAFDRAGFDRITFRHFPRSSRYLDLWGFIVEARPA